MRLFLSSSGLSDSNQQEFFDLLGRDPKGLRVASVPTAMNQESEESRQKYIPIDIADLEKLGMTVEHIDIEQIAEQDIVRAFTPFDVVYVYGGNTFYLMYQARRSGFLQYIHEIIEGKVYFGVSAGSMIVGQDIALAGWPPSSDPNSIGLTDMRGMGLVPFSIQPHWNGEIPKEAASYPYEIRYIKDEDAIVVNT